MQDLVVQHPAIQKQVYYWARRFACQRTPLDDLLQEGLIGVLCAIENFKPDYRGASGASGKFESYAGVWIRGAITKAAQSGLRLGFSVQKRRAIEQAERKFQARTGRDPSVEELAREAECLEEDVLTLRLAQAGDDALSLDEPGWDGDRPRLEVAADEPGPAEFAERTDEAARLRTKVHRAVAKLAPRMREVVRLRYWQDLSVDEVAATMGITTGAVKQQLFRATRERLPRLLQDVRDV
jgi:RNA polymerase sigma factor (sigma-70 family)